MCLSEVSNNTFIKELKVKEKEIEYIKDSFRDDIGPMDVEDTIEEENDEEEALKRQKYSMSVREGLHWLNIGMA